jgi:integrase
MAKEELKDAGIRSLKTEPGKQLVVFDTVMKGLVLTVSAGGTKAWSALHYVGGKPRYHGLGRYPLVSLKQARLKARDFLLDPQAALKQSDRETFAQVAEGYIKRHVEKNGLRTAYEIKRALNVYVLPRWKDRPIADIKRGDVARLLDQIEDDHGASMADAVLSVIRSVMAWYEARQDDYRSPIVKGMRRTTQEQRQRERILDDDEIRAVWKASDEIPVFGAMLKVSLLTAQRRAKVATMKWSDIKDGVWTIQKEPREKSNAGSLKLPVMTWTIIDSQPRIVGNPHVFPATRGGVPLNAFPQRKREIDTKLAGMKPWTIHDLRRTARSLMARAGVKPHIAERVLGHAIAGVEGVYDRHSYDQEKAEALEALERLVTRILNPTDNVVALRQGH